MMREQSWGGRGMSVISLLLRLLHQTVSHLSMHQSIPLLQGFRCLWTQLTWPLNLSPTTIDSFIIIIALPALAHIHIHVFVDFCLRPFSPAVVFLVTLRYLTKKQWDQSRHREEETVKRDWREKEFRHIISPLYCFIPLQLTQHPLHQAHTQILTGLGTWSELKSTNSTVRYYNPRPWLSAPQSNISFPQSS